MTKQDGLEESAEERHARRRSREQRLTSFALLVAGLGTIALVAVVAAGAVNRADAEATSAASRVTQPNAALDRAREELRTANTRLEEANQALASENEELRTSTAALELRNADLKTLGAWSDLPRRIDWTPPPELANQPVDAQIERFARDWNDMSKELDRLGECLARTSGGPPDLLDLVAAIEANDIVRLESLQAWLGPSAVLEGEPRFSEASLDDATARKLARALASPASRVDRLCSFETSRSAFFVEDDARLLITFTQDRRIQLRVDGKAPAGSGLPPVAGTKRLTASRLASGVGPTLADARGPLFVACLDSGTDRPRVCLFDARSPERLCELTGDFDIVRDLAIGDAAPDGSRVVVGLDRSGACFVWTVRADAESGLPRRVSTGIDDSAARLFVGRDHVAVLSSERVAIFRATATMGTGESREPLVSFVDAACSTRALAEWSPDENMLAIATGSGLRFAKKSGDGRFTELARNRFASALDAQDARLSGAWFTTDSTVLLRRGEQIEHWSLGPGSGLEKAARLVAFGTDSAARVFDVHVTRTAGATFAMLVGTIGDGERERIVVTRCRLGRDAADRPELVSIARVDGSDHGSLTASCVSADGATLLLACVTGGYRIGFSEEAPPQDPMATLRAWALNYESVRELGLP